MKAVLFTLFAPAYVQETIIPRLRGRGIHVVRTLEPMHEFGPHVNDKIVREAAKSQGKKFQYLTRKSGQWTDECPGRDPNDIPPPESMQAEVTLLPPERLEAMLRTLVTLRDVGQSYDAIASQLTQFWRAGETAPRDGKSLRRLIETVRERGEPKWFEAWQPAPSTALGPASGNYAPPDVAPDEDDAELLRMFEQDNERLRGELTAERDIVATLRKELADALDGVKTWKTEYEKLHDKHGKLIDRHQTELDAFRQERDRDVGEVRDRIMVIDRARQTAEVELERLRTIASSTQEDFIATRDERVTLNSRVIELEAKIAAAMATAESQTRRAEQADKTIEAMRRDPPTRVNGLGKMLTQVKSLVPAIMSADEALERLAAYAAKQEGI